MDIKSVLLLNTYLRKEYKNDKQGILDVRIRLNNNTEIDIEIQLSPLNVWADRSLYYLSKLYTEQIKPGENYSVFKKCVSISILDFKLFQDSNDFYSCFHIMEDNRHTLYTDKMEFHILELPKLPKELKEDASDILLWAKFISSETKEEFEMLRPKPLEVKPLEDYKLSLVFDNGEHKIFDVKPLISGEWFGQLQDSSIFKTVKIVGNTVEWINGQDICPDDLYYLSKAVTPL